MLAIIKLSARKYMAVDLHSDNTYIGLQTNKGINVSTSNEPLYSGTYSDCLAELNRHAIATNQTVTFEQSKAKQIEVVGKWTKANEQQANERFNRE